MKISIEVYEFGKIKPRKAGYIEMNRFDPDECFNLCNWSECMGSKPKNLHSDISSVGHGVCFTNPENGKKYLSKSFGWLVGDKETIDNYVEQHANNPFWN